MSAAPALALLATLGLSPPPASESAPATQPPESKSPRSPAYVDVLEPLPEAERSETTAKQLKNAAKVAFQAGRFEDAIELLAESYRAYPDVSLLYALGSAHRRAYEIEGDVEHWRLSIRRYQQYLSAAPDAEFADLAQNYLTAMLAERDLGSIDSGAVTRILVSTAAEDASMTIDGGPTLPAPGVIAVEPGAHEIRVVAPGYHDFVHSIDVPEGTTYPVQAELDGLPAMIEVEGTKQASVRLDGVIVGQLPLAEPLQVEPGAHVIGVSKHGRDPFRAELELGRDARRSVLADLDVSNQRVISYLLLGIGGAGLASTGVLIGFTYDRQIQARSFSERLEQGELSTAEYERYSELADQRNNFRAAAVLTGLGSSALFLVGVVLFAYESPRALDSLARVSPRLGPNSAGLTLRF